MYLLRKFKDTLCKSVWVRKLTDRLLLSRFASFPPREGDISCRDLHQVAVCPVGPLREGLKKNGIFHIFYLHFGKNISFRKPLDNGTEAEN